MTRLTNAHIGLAFFRPSVAEELAKAATLAKGIAIPKESIFVYPYAWLNVKIGGGPASPFPSRITYQYPFDIKDDIANIRAIRTAPPEPVDVPFNPDSPDGRVVS